MSRSKEFERHRDLGGPCLMNLTLNGHLINTVVWSAVIGHLGSGFGPHQRPFTQLCLGMRLVCWSWVWYEFACEFINPPAWASPVGQWHVPHPLTSFLIGTHTPKQSWKWLSKVNVFWSLQTLPNYWLTDVPSQGHQSPHFTHTRTGWS